MDGLMCQSNRRLSPRRLLFVLHVKPKVNDVTCGSSGAGLEPVPTMEPVLWILTARRTVSQSEKLLLEQHQHFAGLEQRTANVRCRERIILTKDRLKLLLSAISRNLV